MTKQTIWIFTLVLITASSVASARGGMGGGGGMGSGMGNAGNTARSNNHYGTGQQGMQANTGQMMQQQVRDPSAHNSSNATEPLQTRQRIHEPGSGMGITTSPQ